MQTVTAMVLLIATATATVTAIAFPIARTAARTTLAAIKSKRQHPMMPTRFCRTRWHKLAEPDAYCD
jgi:hypothetical protein